MTVILYSTRNGFNLGDGYIDDLSNLPFTWYVQDEYRHELAGDFLVPEVVHIELWTMEDINKLSKTFGELIYTGTTFNGLPVIEIYDDYRE
jgi:hypothetical protein